VAEPIREQALAAIVTVLTGMTGIRPWGGTYANPPGVERIWKAIQQINRFPHFLVLEAPGSTRATDTTDSATSAIFLHRFRVRVVGYVQGDANVPRSTWLQRAADDVFRTLMKNATLGGLVQDIDADGEAEEVDDGEFDELGAVLGFFGQIYIVTIREALEVG
jgi:hypothetical protein